MKEEKKCHSRGFTLLEILLVLGILGVIAVFTIGIAHSIRNLTKVNDTKSRMEQIAAKAREYYRAHECLPFPVTQPPVSLFNVGPGSAFSVSGNVPVQADALNMEQKFRLDAWGRYFSYRTVYRGAAADGITMYVNYNSTNPDFLLNDITYLTLNGKPLAAILISGGPDQIIQTVDSGGGVFDTTGDDIVIGIEVSQEAVEMAIEELKVFQAKVKAFDAIYEGIDNDGLGGVDEDNPTGCVRQEGSTTCPPNGSTNDPNCGTVTLDNFESGYYTGCSANFGDNARDFICDFYSLANGLRIDPWLRGYIWGCDNTVCATAGGGVDIDTSNPRYHKFFSRGPDRATSSISGTPSDDLDDIIP